MKPPSFPGQLHFYPLGLSQCILKIIFPLRASVMPWRCTG